MRIDRFQRFACQAYATAPEILSAEPYSEERKRPYGIELKLANGRTVRHAITRVPVAGENLGEPEPEPVQGEPAGPIEPRPEPAGGRDRQTAVYLAAVLAGAAHPETARVHVYAETSQDPGFGVEFHSGAKIHMLLT